MTKPNRPRDLNQRAKNIVDIATGEDSDANDQPKDERDPAAVALGSKGGKARAQNLTAKQRSDFAKRAAKKRWEAKKKSG